MAESGRCGGIEGFLTENQHCAALLQGRITSEGKNLREDGSTALESVKKIYRSDGSYYVNFHDLCEIMEIPVATGIDPSKPIERVISQAEYTQPGEVVICTGYYNIERSINLAVERGAFVVFCPQYYAQKYWAGKEEDSKNPRNVIGMDNPLECIHRFEVWRKSNCKARVVTITGSVGKTTTTGLVNSIITNTFNTLTHHPMSNSHGAVLRNVQRLTPLHEVWVQEVGGVKPGYVESSARFLCPDALILTNIGNSHLDLYKSRESIFWDKTSLERYMKDNGVVLINLDDDMLRNSIPKFTHKIITFAVDQEEADYRAENIVTTRDGTQFDVVCAEGRFPVTLQLFGEHNAYNALAAIALARWMGIPIFRSAELVKDYQAEGIRQHMVNIGGYHMLIDCFNAEAKTVLGAAETLSKIPVEGAGKRIMVAGHIDKLGAASKDMHYQLGKDMAAIKGIDEFVFFAGDSRCSYEAAVEAGCTSAHWMNSREELEDWMRENITCSDLTVYKSGQFEAALAKSIDHVYGTVYQNGTQFNEGIIKEKNGFRFRVRKETVEIAGVTAEYNSTDLVIPNEFDGVKITYIADRAFTKQRRIESAVIPDTVKNIGELSFYICAGLRTLRLPASLRIIGANAFNCCPLLKTVSLPEGTIHLGRHSFYDCRRLEQIYIPDSVGYIGEDAFALCRRLTISCRQGSYAERYAKENRIKCSYIG